MPTIYSGEVIYLAGIGSDIVLLGVLGCICRAILKLNILNCRKIVVFEDNFKNGGNSVKSLACVLLRILNWSHNRFLDMDEVNN